MAISPLYTPRDQSQSYSVSRQDERPHRKKEAPREARNGQGAVKFLMASSFIVTFGKILKRKKVKFDMHKRDIAKLLLFV